MSYRAQTGGSVYTFIVDTVRSLYNKYAPYTYQEVRAKTKELGQDYSPRQFMMQILLIGGLFGLLWSMVLISVIIYMIYSELALHFLKAKRKQYILLLKSIGLNIIIGVVCYLLLCILPDWPNIVLIIIVAVAYLLLLVFVSYVLRMLPFFYLCNNFQNLIGNLRKRNR